MYCSPSHFKHSTRGTCFSQDEIKTIADDINKKRNAKTAVKTLNDIKNHFAPKCGNKEYCWIEQLSYETRKRLEHVFRPRKPRAWTRNKRTWLNTDDINFVMIQYEALHKDFKYLGTHPIDFAQRYDGFCVGRDLCDFDIKNLGDKKRFAMVLNLDRHDESGSHWVSLYCNLNPAKKNFGIYYYDSVSSPPGDEVVAFMESICKQVRKYHPRLSKRFERRENTVQRQFKNTECGMFCIVYLTQCVKNIYSFDEICTKMKTDDDINKIRDAIYRPV